MQSIALADAEAMIGLLATVGNPTVEVPLDQRKRELLEGLARMIDADVWLWIVARINPQMPGDAMALALIDGGWQCEAQRADAFRYMSDPNLSREITRHLHTSAMQERSSTITRQDVLSNEEWQSSAFGCKWRAIGLDPMIISTYPIGRGLLSNLGFHRRLGQLPFTDRDRTVVHVMIQQIDWLHRAGSSVPASDNVLELSPRERQVTMLLLGGLSHNQVAARLRVSRHTITDYVKGIYGKLDVHSQAELLAKFIPVGT
jgi:DNA-binding CsgD family transcriptional regulator